MNNISQISSNNQISSNTKDEIVGNIARSCLHGQSIGRLLANNEQFAEMEVYDLGALIDQMINKFNEIENHLDDLSNIS